jgi:serine/threonine protein kinase
VTTVVGNYELVAKLGEGGMAETHVARSLEDGAIVVVKQLLPQFAGDAGYIEMFLDEARVISSLRHPNVVVLREFGFHAELPFLAMEYLHGVDLKTLLRSLVRRKQRIPTEVALYIACSMCSGLHHAHEARTIDGKPMDVAHRDVSPQNVVLTFEGAVKLIDFGIATARGRTHETRGGALKGKVRYMAPEQVRAASADRRTDVYATGVVLYELLALRRPYVGKQAQMSEFSMMMAIVNHDVVPVHAVRPDLPGALGQVIAKATALDPASRHQTAAELQAELRAIAHELGVTLGPHKLAQLLEDVVGRHKAVGGLPSSAQIIDVVSEVDAARTQVDERHDPATIEHSELGPLARGAAPAPAAPEPVSGMVVDKIIEHDRTRLRFLRDPDPGFRWTRMLEGVEGLVEIDFTEVVGLTVPSVAAARDALQALGVEVSKLQLFGVPIALAAELDDRCRIVSASCRGWCPSCRTHRATVLEYAEMRARLSDGRDLPCSQCGTPLHEVDRSSIASGGAPGDAHGATGAPPPPSNVRAADAVAAAIKPERIARQTPARAFVLAVTVTACVVAGLAGVVGWRLWGRRSAAPLPPAGQSWRNGPAWVVEASGAGTSELAALAEARLHALALVAAEIEAGLPERIQRLRGDSPEVAPSLLDRPAEARVELDQLDAKSVAQGGRVQVTARYQIAEAARQRALDFYTKVASIWGLELINAPPSRRAGVLVIAAPSGPVSVGDRILSVGGLALRSLDSLQQLGELRSRPQLDLVIERQERHTLQIKTTESQ